MCNVTWARNVTWASNVTSRVTRNVTLCPLSGTILAHARPIGGIAPRPHTFGGLEGGAGQGFSLTCVLVRIAQITNRLRRRLDLCLGRHRCPVLPGSSLGPPWVLPGSSLGPPWVLPGSW